MRGTEEPRWIWPLSVQVSIKTSSDWLGSCVHHSSLTRSSNFTSIHRALQTEWDMLSQHKQNKHWLYDCEMYMFVCIESVLSFPYFRSSSDRQKINSESSHHGLVHEFQLVYHYCFVHHSLLLSYLFKVFVFVLVYAVEMQTSWCSSCQYFLEEQ